MAHVQKNTLALPADASAHRLTELRIKLLELLPETKFGSGVDPMGHTTMTIQLSNGLELLACGDFDLPWLLFEIIRTVQSGDVPKHAFEGCSSPAYAYTDKLSGQEALDLLVQYAQLPATPTHQ